MHVSFVIVENITVVILARLKRKKSFRRWSGKEGRREGGKGVFSVRHCDRKASSDSLNVIAFAACLPPSNE